MQPLVKTIGISKHYPSGGAIVRAISEVSLSVDRGEFIAIRGRSGSGKSTLLNILGLLEQPDCGEYALSGSALANLNEPARAMVRNRKIGFVFQLPALLPRATAQENVELPLIYLGATRRERRGRAESALDQVGLSDRIRHYPNQLSGGEQQRVAIARAIVTGPELILADEPTGALDSATSEQILSLFEDLHRDGRTIIVVTHGLEVAQRAQRQITLHDGRIVKDDASSIASSTSGERSLSTKL
jgi:putative ABC transport system ATP-binding protein